MTGVRRAQRRVDNKAVSSLVRKARPGSFNPEARGANIQRVQFQAVDLQDLEVPAEHLERGLGLANGRDLAHRVRGDSDRRVRADSAARLGRHRPRERPRAPSGRVQREAAEDANSIPRPRKVP